MTGRRALLAWIRTALDAREGAARQRAYVVVAYDDPDGWTRRGKYTSIREALFEVLELESGDAAAAEEAIEDLEADGASTGRPCSRRTGDLLSR